MWWVSLRKPQRNMISTSQAGGGNSAASTVTELSLCLICSVMVKIILHCSWQTSLQVNFMPSVSCFPCVPILMVVVLRGGSLLKDSSCCSEPLWASGSMSEMGIITVYTSEDCCQTPCQLRPVLSPREREKTLRSKIWAGTKVGL